MKVGVDARALSRPLTGIGRYTLEMCRALSKLEHVELYLYSPDQIADGCLRGLDACRVRTKNFSNGILRQFWSGYYLPSWAGEDGVDVFWGPAHRLPSGLPKNIPRVVTIHDLVWKMAPETMRSVTRMLESYLSPRSIQRSDQVVADSVSTAMALSEQYGVPADRVDVIPLGTKQAVESRPPELLVRYGIDRRFILFVGTREPRKNLHRLLTAYSELGQPTRDSVMLVIAGGGGWGDMRLDEWIADLGVADHVRVLGYTDQHTLETLYANALFLTMPSLYEGFGLPLVESMSYGVPVLTANNSSMPEVAGDAGLLVDAADVESIRSGLKRMIEDDALRNEFAVNAKRRAARFSWDSSARQLIRVFEKAIAMRSSLVS